MGAARVEDKVVQSTTLAKETTLFSSPGGTNRTGHTWQTVNQGAVTPTEFEERLAALARAHEQSVVNVGCLACERCERCSDSTFLKDCKNVTRSHYCTSSVDSSDCTQSSFLTACLGCSHCERCERCVSSAYLVRCMDCSGCTYCFGCVGLSKKDFHILNEPYERQAYFAKVAELRKALRI